MFFVALGEGQDAKAEGPRAGRRVTLLAHSVSAERPRAGRRVRLFAHSVPPDQRQRRNYECSCVGGGWVVSGE
jgi:hypothetical protein